MWVEKNGPVYRIRDWRGDQKVTLESGFSTKTAAKARMTALRADQLRGDFIDPRAGRITLSDWIDAWWPMREASLKPTAAHSEGGRVRNHIRPLLGDLPLEDITGLTVQQWVTALATGAGPMGEDVRRPRRPLGPKTIRHCHGLLSQALDAAVGQRLIRANPCRNTRLPEVVPHEMRFLSEPEIGRLITAVPERWRPLVLLLVGTGLRWGEACALRMCDVDVLAGRLTVVRSMQELSGSGEIVFGTPKSRMSRRTVTFSRRVADALTGVVAGKGREDLVFTAPMGGPVRTRNFRRGWVRWTAAAGLAGLRIHDLRHTHAAILISAGRPLTAIQRRLGHASLAVTSDVYGHLLEHVDEGILDAIEGALTHVDAAELAAEVAAELTGDAR